MSEEIEKTIKMIDQKIRALENAKNTLLSVFVEGDMPLKNDKPDKKQKKETRKDTVMKVLKQNGPMNRNRLATITGFTRGTLSYVLNDKEVFISKNGLWGLIEQAPLMNNESGFFSDEELNPTIK